MLWHLLSLDAPTVAVVWAAFAGWCAGVRIPYVDLLALFVAVWLLYTADRLLDARPPFMAPVIPELRERHVFHARHRARLLPLMAGSTLLLAALLHRTTEPDLHLWVLLSCLLFAWLLLVHVRPDTNPHHLPKELAVGVFFPAATFVPTVTRSTAPHSALLFPALLFGALCMLNCLFLYRWEHPATRQDAHWTTHFGARHAPLFAGALMLLCLAATLLPPWHDRLASKTSFPHKAAFDLACLLGAALLAGLHLHRRHFAAHTLRALADLVLLAPLPVLLWVHLWF